MTDVRPECDFATIAEMSERLAELVKEGLGGFPVQVLVVPDSTLQAIAKMSGHVGKPALMIDLPSDPPGTRLPVCIVTADRLTRDGGMPSTRTQ